MLGSKLFLSLVHVSCQDPRGCQTHLLSKPENFLLGICTLSVFSLGFLRFVPHVSGVFMRKHHCGSQDGWAGLDGAAQEDRVLKATAVGVTWLRRNDCQQVMQNSLEV